MSNRPKVCWREKKMKKKFAAYFNVKPSMVFFINCKRHVTRHRCHHGIRSIITVPSRDPFGDWRVIIPTSQEGDESGIFKGFEIFPPRVQFNSMHFCTYTHLVLR